MILNKVEFCQLEKSTLPLHMATSNEAPKSLYCGKIYGLLIEDNI